MLGFSSIAEFAVCESPGSTTIMTASAGSFALSGQAATFQVRQVSAVGSFTLTGIATSFRTSMAEAVATFSLSGVNTLFRVAISSNAGAFSISGDCTFRTSISVDAGAYTLTGVDAVFQARLAADTCAYTVTVNPSALFYLDPDPAEFVLTGNDAPLVVRMLAEPGSFTIEHPSEPRLVIIGGHGDPPHRPKRRAKIVPIERTIEKVYDDGTRERVPLYRRKAEVGPPPAWLTPSVAPQPLRLPPAPPTSGYGMIMAIARQAEAMRDLDAMMMASHAVAARDSQDMRDVQSIMAVDAARRQAQDDQDITAMLELI